MKSVKTKKKILTMKLTDGQFLGSPVVVHKEAVDYFADFLKSKHRSPLPNLSFCRPCHYR